MRTLAGLLLVCALCTTASAYDITDFNFVWNGIGSGTLYPPSGLHVDGPADNSFARHEGFFRGTSPATQLLTFDFSYHSDDNFDPAFWRVNGGPTHDFANGYGTVTGNIQVSLNAGDVFDVGVWSGDGFADAGHLDVTNFYQSPEPTALGLLALGALLAARRR